MEKTDLVNVKQGTASVPKFSNGNTLPLTQLPFAMAAFCPQTDGQAGNWFYHPESHSLDGVRLTHQTSPWIGDYGALLIFPQTDIPCEEDYNSWSGYRPEDAVLRPDYLKVKFLRSQCEFELTPTERGAYIRLKYASDYKKWFTVKNISGMFSAQVSDDGKLITGYTTCMTNSKAINFKMYFAIEFTANVCSAESAVLSEKAFHIEINRKDIEAQLAVSYISKEQALQNLKNENTGDFEAARKTAEKIWREKLSLIEIETQNEKLLKTFYSCLYRVHLFPNKAYEIDKNGREVHYSPETGAIYTGKRYTGNGFWDTYRTVYPLLSVISPDVYSEMLEGFIADYKEGGWLPRWTAMGAMDCMPSTLIDAVIADAAVKGIIDGELLKTAYEGMLKHAEHNSEQRCYGRNGAEAYRKLGFVPCDLEKESVNLTLDAAYGDFCIAEIAKILGDHENEEKYRKSSLNYRNLFDKESGFMRVRDSRGKTKEDFDPFSWGGGYTEGSAWQNSFAVPHDTEGLAELYGGKEPFLRKIDEIFAAPAIYRVGTYGMEIHEMTEMAAADFGQCAISNQPSFHLPYIYAVMGETGKSAYWVKRLCTEAFDSSERGFPGDEDNGTMAAWYIFSVLGIYPYCPGKAEFVNTGKMLADSVKICGKEFNAAGYGNTVPYGIFRK